MEAPEAQAFARMLAGIAELYGKSLSRPLSELYWNLLKTYSLSELQIALKAHFCNPEGGQFFPKPADLIRHLEGGSGTKALQAWTVVERAIRQIGSYQSLAFEDPLIHAAIEDMGGWMKLCAITLKELPFCSLAFQKRYAALVHKAPRRYPPYFPGVIESSNSAKGYASPKPLLVGHEPKAQAVIQGGTPLPPLCAGRASSFKQWIVDIHQIQAAKDPSDA
jgi:Domain of unknown function (DUF6475)